MPPIDIKMNVLSLTRVLSHTLKKRTLPPTGSYAMVKTYAILVLIGGWVLLSIGCAHHFPIARDSHQVLYLAESSDAESPSADIIKKHAPVFRVFDYQDRFNRIGRPTAEKNRSGSVIIGIDTDRPTYFVENRTFTTDKDTYTNLIYRIQFPSVPYSLVPFNLTAGQNPGLMVVITLNRQNEPLLVTTVHTCGCYKAFTATTALPENAWPQKYRDSKEKISVYGEKLPVSVDYRSKINPRLLLDLRPEVHRVMDLEIIDAAALKDIRSSNFVLKVSIKPSEYLTRLPINGETTSFYHASGWKKDHVKGAVKPFETLFMSWLSLDFLIGTDKVYGSVDNPFYTSIKPWNRLRSDTNDFPRFLKFWGWGL